MTNTYILTFIQHNNFRWPNTFIWLTSYDKRIYLHLFMTRTTIHYTFIQHNNFHHKHIYINIYTTQQLSMTKHFYMVNILWQTHTTTSILYKDYDTLHFFMAYISWQHNNFHDKHLHILTFTTIHNNFFMVYISWQAHILTSIQHNNYSWPNTFIWLTSYDNTTYFHDKHTHINIYYDTQQLFYGLYLMTSTHINIYTTQQLSMTKHFYMVNILWQTHISTSIHDKDYIYITHLYNTTTFMTNTYILTSILYKDYDTLHFFMVYISWHTHISTSIQHNNIRWPNTYIWLNISWQHNNFHDKHIYT